MSVMTKGSARAAAETISRSTIWSRNVFLSASEVPLGRKRGSTRCQASTYSRVVMSRCGMRASTVSGSAGLEAFAGAFAGAAEAPPARARAQATTIVERVKRVPGRLRRVSPKWPSRLWLNGKGPPGGGAAPVSYQESGGVGTRLFGPNFRRQAVYERCRAGRMPGFRVRTLVSAPANPDRHGQEASMTLRFSRVIAVVLALFALPSAARAGAIRLVSSD